MMLMMDVVVVVVVVVNVIKAIMIRMKTKTTTTTTTTTMIPADLFLIVTGPRIRQSILHSACRQLLHMQCGLHSHRFCEPRVQVRRIEGWR